MAKIANVRKVFNFVIEIDGVNQFEIQKCNVPDVEIDVTLHGDTNGDVKTAGRVKVGEITLEKIKPMTQDNFIWNWLISAQNRKTGAGGRAEDYKKIIVIKEMDERGLTTLSRWLCQGVWCSKCSQNTLDRMSSDNIIQTATLQVDDIEPI